MGKKINMQEVGQILTEHCYEAFYALTPEAYEEILSRLEQGIDWEQDARVNIVECFPQYPERFIMEDAELVLCKGKNGDPGIAFFFYIFSNKSLVRAIKDIRIVSGDFNITSQKDILDFKNGLI